MVLARGASTGIALVGFATAACGSASEPQPVLVGWLEQFGGESSALGSSVAVDAAGDVVVTGSFDEPIDVGGGKLDHGGLQGLLLAKFDASGAHVWSRTSQATVDGSMVRGEALAIDSARNVIAVGNYVFGVDLGGGPLDSIGRFGGFVLKTDPDGKYLWHANLNPPEAAQASSSLDVVSVGVDARNNVVIGAQCHAGAQVGSLVLPDSGERGVCVIAFDPAGTPLWGKRFDALYSAVSHESAIAVDSAGDVLVAGQIPGRGVLGFGPVQTEHLEDVFVLKLSAAGEPLWVRTFGGSDVAFKALTVGPSNEALLVATGGGDVDLGPGPPGGDPYDSRPFIVKLSADGDPTFSRWFASGQEFAAADTNAAGGIILGGAARAPASDSEPQMLLAELDANGIAQRTGSRALAWVYYPDVAWHPDGGFALAGSVEDDEKAWPRVIVGKLRFELSE